jgi:hypothetical protein
MRIPPAVLPVLWLWETAASFSPLPAAEPQIYLIEQLNATNVALHFETDANRAYSLQAKTALTNATWTQIYHVPALPFPQHFVIVQTMTNQHRFYRLTATP